MRDGCAELQRTMAAFDALLRDQLPAACTPPPASEAVMVLRSALDEVRSRQAADVMRLHEAAAGLGRQLAEADEEVQQVKRRVEDIRLDLEKHAVATGGGGAATQAASVRRAVELLEARSLVSSLRSQLSLAQQQAKAAVAEVDRLRGQVAAERARGPGRDESEVRELMSRISDGERWLADADQRMQDFKSQLERCKRHESELDLARLGLVAELSKEREAAASLRADVAEAEKRLEDFERQVQELEQKVDECTKRGLDQADTKLSLTAKVRSEEELVAKLRVELAEQAGLVEAAAQRIMLVERELGENKQAMTDLREANETLQSDLRKEREEVLAARDAL
jgi:chromosome segregation ATPase